MDDRDTLANLIDPNALELDTYPWPKDAADRVLASDWLAARDARVRAETLEDAAEKMPVREYSDSGLFSRPLELGDIQRWLRARAADYRKETTE